MPFLDQLQHWATVQPQATAVEVGDDRLSFAGLRDLAAARVAAMPFLSSVCLPNGIEFVVDIVAGVAGGRRCAVRDPAWPAAERHDVQRRLDSMAVSVPGDAAGSRGAELSDGPPDSVFLVGFTSGTTSLPKAFTRTRRSWQMAFELSRDYFGLSAQDRTLAPGPLTASLNLYALAESLHAGAAFVTLPRFDVGAALACITDRGITRLVAAPTALLLIGERALASGVDGSSLTGIISAGARLDAATLVLLRRWAPNAAIFDYYGAAELSFVAASVLRPGEPAAPRTTAVGLPFPGVEIRIVDDAGRSMAEGVPGNIFVRSPLVSEGYAWGDDGEAFRRDGDWCTVGDQGYLAADGVLHFLGRRADMIVTAGRNVYPQEVETALQAVEGVEAVVATGIPDAYRGTRLVAAVLGSPEADARRLRAAGRSLLADAKRPLSYYALAELPLTATGKVSRQLLARWIDEEDARVTPLA
jgi:long-chain acyl-CoA synthetase